MIDHEFILSDLSIKDGQYSYRDNAQSHTHINKNITKLIIIIKK